jgi:3-oxoacyl-[acyl-carrier protein] reductase
LHELFFGFHQALFAPLRLCGSKRFSWCLGGSIDYYEVNTMTLTNEIALVTGASRGIGQAIALELGRQGATVIGTATSAGGAQAISDAFAGASIKGVGKVLNVTDADSIDTLIKDIESEFGSVGILVNNAGITRDTLLMRMKADDWDAVIDTNLSSVFRLSKACMRSMMKARKGRIINIASVVGVTGNPGQANYAAAKAGMIGFAKSLAREVGSRGITVNTVAPGFIDTDMTRALTDEQRAALLTNIPLARLGAPQDIANAVVFLASEAAAYITGETLHVNGGMHMV